MLELFTHAAITGDEVEQVFPLESSPWSTNLSGTGTCSFEFGVDDTPEGLTLGEVRRLFSPNNTVLSLRWGSEVVGAWKTEEWVYDEDTSKVTVPGVEIRNETKWRMTYPLSDYTWGTLSVTNRSYSGAVRAILNRFIQWSADWKYPIDLPADGAGTFSATWEFWRKFTIDDLLVQIEDEGQEVLLRPYLTAGKQLRFQTYVDAKIRIGAEPFHLQAEDRPLAGVQYRESGVGQVTGGQGLGGGMGQDQPVERALPVLPFLIPVRDAKRDFPDLSGTRLQKAVQAWYDANRLVATQWSVGSLTASDTYPASLAAPGTGWMLSTRGHRIFPDGDHLVRVISASGSMSDQISVEVQSGA